MRGSAWSAIGSLLRVHHTPAAPQRHNRVHFLTLTPRPPLTSTLCSCQVGVCNAYTTHHVQPCGHLHPPPRSPSHTLFQHHQSPVQPQRSGVFSDPHAPSWAKAFNSLCWFLSLSQGHNPVQTIRLPPGGFTHLCLPRVAFFKSLVVGWMGQESHLQSCN